MTAAYPVAGARTRKTRAIGRMRRERDMAISSWDAHGWRMAAAGSPKRDMANSGHVTIEIGLCVSMPIGEESEEW